MGIGVAGFDENGSVLKITGFRRYSGLKVRDQRIFQQQFLQFEHSQHARHVDIRDHEGDGQPFIRPKTSRRLPSQPYNRTRQIRHFNCRQEHPSLRQQLQIQYAQPAFP